MDDEALRRLRTENLEHIFSAASHRRLIVAGPGTGKTFTFKQVIARATDEVLVLSFLNNLVDDLARDLGDSDGAHLSSLLSQSATQDGR